MKLSFRTGLLLLASILLASALQAGHFPAAWLFGPLVVSALFAIRDWEAVVLPRPVYVAAQAVSAPRWAKGFLPRPC